MEDDIGAGAAYGTAKSGIGIAGVGTFRPDLIMKVHTDPWASFRDNVLMKLSATVAHTSRDGRDHCGLFSCHCSPHRG